MKFQLNYTILFLIPDNLHTVICMQASKMPRQNIHKRSSNSVSISSSKMELTTLLDARP